MKSSSEIDTRAFMWTFDCLDEDHELESFFSGLPGFRTSKVVKDPLPSLTEEEMLKLYGTLDGLFDRTFSSDLLPAPIKDRRALICAKAVDPVHTPVHRSFGQLKPIAFRILDLILYNYHYSGSVATGIAKVLRGWGNDMDEDKIAYAKLTICLVLATSQPRDDSWYNFASDELGFPETSLRDYAAQGDSLSLVMLIHFVRRQFTLFRKLTWSHKDSFSSILSKGSKFDAEDTSSELQHEFCALWNQIVREAQETNDREMAQYILRSIRNVFLALHQGTDSAPTHFSVSISTERWDDILKKPSSYPSCKVLDHRSDSPHTHDDGVSAALARAVPHDSNNTASVPSINSPDSLPSSQNAPPPVDRALTDALSLDNQIYVQESTQPIGQTTAEGRHIPTISPSLVIEPSRTTQPSTASPYPNSNASASQSADISVGQTALIRAHSNYLNVQSSPSPTPVLNTIFPTGLLSFQGATRSDFIFIYSSNRR